MTGESELGTDREPSTDEMRLPRGRHKLPPGVVSEIQRSRMLAATGKVVAEKGYAALAVRDIIEVAGVSRTTFYEHFQNKVDCVASANEAAFQCLATTIYRACAGGDEWPEKLAAAMRGAVRFAVGSPEEAQLLLFDAVGGEPLLAERILASNEHLIGMLRAGREHCPSVAGLPEVLERGLVGGVTSIVASRLMNDQADRLPAIEPELVQLMLIPYVGREDARRLALAV